MEALNSLAQNGLWSLGTVVVIIIILVICVKRGLIGGNIKGIKIGNNAEAEIKIRSMQDLYSKSLLESTVSFLPETCEYYHKRFVIAECLDEVQRMIRENHITDDSVYIETEYSIVYNIVLKYTKDKYFKSEEFRAYLHGLMERLIKQLVKIRKQYSAA